MRRIIDRLIAPVAVSEDARRQEFVLNVLLVGVLALSLTALVQVGIGLVTLGDRFKGASPWAVLAVIGFLLVLYRLSRRGYSRVAAYVFVVSFAVIATAGVLDLGHTAAGGVADVRAGDRDGRDAGGNPVLAGDDSGGVVCHGGVGQLGRGAYDASVLGVDE
jgi:hypothetical protein